MPNQYYPRYENPFLIPIWLPTDLVVHPCDCSDQTMCCLEVSPISDTNIDYSYDDDGFDASLSLIGTSRSVYNLKQSMMNLSNPYIYLRNDKPPKKKNIGKKLLKRIAKTAFGLTLTVVTQSMSPCC